MSRSRPSRFIGEVIVRSVRSVGSVRSVPHSQGINPNPFCCRGHKRHCLEPMPTARPALELTQSHRGRIPSCLSVIWLLNVEAAAKKGRRRHLALYFALFGGIGYTANTALQGGRRVSGRTVVMRVGRLWLCVAVLAASGRATSASTRSRQGCQELRGRFVEERHRCAMQKPYIPPSQVLQVV